jgi:DNA-binding PadR family transcriptional regulator
MDRSPETRRLTEWVLLGLLDESPNHGFALARLLGRGGEIGRVWAASRPLTYRAIEQLVADDLITPARTEAGDGPVRTVYRLRPAGRRAVRQWLATPVARFRDVRAELIVKLLLLERSNRSTAPLLRDQRRAFADALALAQGTVETDAVSRWRRSQAHAIEAFLESGTAPLG